MMTLIVGHRGVGKTSFLKRLKQYFEKLHISNVSFDLDEEIEKSQGKSIAAIFEEKGESHFRELERSTIEKLVKTIENHQQPIFISVGAGFQGPYPEDSQILWLRRETDKDGRIFFDRPQLDKSKSPMGDYMARFIDREYGYSQTCDEQLMLLEGYDREAVWEEDFLGIGKKAIGGCLTLFEKDLRKFSGGESFLARRMHWGVDRFELRDDLLEDVLIRYVLGLIPRSRLLLSFRSVRKSILHEVVDAGAFFDWPMEKGLCPFGDPDILSLHSREGSLQDTLLRFEDSAPEKSHLKLAVEIKTFQELYDGHTWWKENPGQRSFLPMSHDGRWRWYRSLFGKMMKIGFFREGPGSGLDQPYFSEWVRSSKHFTKFGAVLGWPAHHSQSPAEHDKFFSNHQLPFVSIPLEDRGDFHFHVEILRKMGLIAAAVTSPYKHRAFELCSEAQKQASKVKSVNTLMYRESDKSWIGANTDIDGLQTVKDLYPELGNGENGVVWGGGGTQEVIKTLFSSAQRYSARQGTPIGGDVALENPKIVIWAVGRSRQDLCQWPPESWKPQFVVDLNYTMDSPGREYALKTGAEYISGLTMFQSQARAQQRFWIEHKL